MPFAKISDNTTCNCFIDANENTTDSFVRKVRRSESLKDSDFRNNFERGRNPLDINNCEEVCGLHGVSLEIWTEASQKPLMDKYITTAALAPKSKNNLCVIKFISNSGLVKHTPNQDEYNEFHYDFYKEDSFQVNSLVLVDMIQLVVA